MYNQAIESYNQLYKYPLHNVLKKKKNSLQI